MGLQSPSLKTCTFKSYSLLICKTTVCSMSISQKLHVGLPTANFRPFFFPPFLGVWVFIAPVLVGANIEGWGFVAAEGFCDPCLKNRTSSNSISHHRNKYSNKKYYCFDEEPKFDSPMKQIKNKYNFDIGSITANHFCLYQMHQLDKYLIEQHNGPTPHCCS